MRTSPRHALAALVVGLAVVACSGGSETLDTATTGVPLGSLPDQGSTALPSDSTATTVAGSGTTPPGDAQTGPVQIDVVVGRDDGPDRIERVVVGADVTVNITNPDAADEFHLHGIELERAVDAGVMATFNFTADRTGTFEIESHETGAVLVVIEVVEA